MKNIFNIRDRLIEFYKNFSTSFSRPKASDIRSKLNALFEAEIYWRSPLIQINPNYKYSNDVEELANRHELCRNFRCGR